MSVRRPTASADTEALAGAVRFVLDALAMAGSEAGQVISGFTRLRTPLERSRSGGGQGAADTPHPTVQ